MQNAICNAGLMVIGDLGKVYHQNRIDFFTFGFPQCLIIYYTSPSLLLPSLRRDFSAILVSKLFYLHNR
jgi:hypothetical protein